jgi:hypothetical protein
MEEDMIAYIRPTSTTVIYPGAAVKNGIKTNKSMSQIGKKTALLEKHDYFFQS